MNRMSHGPRLSKRVPARSTHASRDATTPGRPPEYDKGFALSSALSVFWRKGYEATSLVDLCEATRMSKSTLYAVFGDKRQLFLAAIQAYSADLVAELKREYLA